jgi:hypothetical protein
VLRIHPAINTSVCAIAANSASQFIIEGQGMNIDARHFHRLYGVKKQRMTFHSKDALDYALMILICAAVVLFAYGPAHVMAVAGLALCAFMLAMFPVRHGVKLGMPMILARPQDVLYSLLYKIQNIKLPYVVAVGVLLIENYIILLTPNLPHHVELMRKVALYLFYGHFIVISVYRTAILIAHLHKQDLVREILMQSIWKKRLEKQPSILLEILHAYFTGMLTHIVLLVPWYLVITHVNFSIVLLPATALAGAFIQMSFVKVINAWFYRDHWVSHNSEFDFVYLHGSHHDAIPSGLIGVAGNGYLEGLFRGAIAFPTAFCSPCIAALYYTLEVKGDIDLHQYIPGVFPKLSREFYEVGQHSLHHFGRLEPYSFALNLDQPQISAGIRKQLRFLPIELKHSIKLDERLTGYQWDNPRYRWFMDLVDRYQTAAVQPSNQPSKELS